MALIEWDPQYSVGIPAIDDQHKGLFKLLNDLHDAMKSGKGRDILGKTLNDLINYTVTHFQHEEMLFDKHGYIDSLRHKTEHASLTKQAQELKVSFEKGGMITLQVMEFLKG